MGVDRSFYHVDPGEEIASILPGVKNAAGKRVAVVLPPDPTLFRNDLNLRLLLVYAREGQKELALVTQDAAVIRLASYFDIPVYCDINLVWQPEGLATAGDVTEPLPITKLSSASISRVRTDRHRLLMQQRLATAAIAIGALILLAFAYSSRVIVTITPNLQYVESEVQLPMQAMTRHPVAANVTATSQVSSSGQRSVGISPAIGTVIFFNETQKEISVPKGTLVATDGGTTFSTTKAIQVPPVTIEYFMQVPVGTKTGQAEVSVQALSLGSMGNVAAGRILRLPQGPTSLRVTNPEPTRNGADQMRAVVTANDVSLAQKQVLQALQDACKVSLSAKAGDDALLILSSVMFDHEKVTVSPASGAEAAAVIASASAEAQGEYILLTQVLNAALDNARRTLPTDTELIGAPRLEYITDVLVQEDYMKVALRYPVGPHIDVATVLDTIVGRTPLEAGEVLHKKGIPVNLDVSGSDSKRLPRWKSWIKVIIADPVHTVHTAEAFRE